MAYLVPEDWSYINGENDMKGIEVLEVDGAFLMSMLEESQFEGSDEERLNCLIQSLQAEINPVSAEVPDESASEEEDSQLCSPEHSSGSSCSVAPDVDFSWIDHMEMVPSSPSDDMNWYMDQYVDDMGSMAEFGGVADYAEICNGIQLENSPWQESYNTVLKSVKS